MAKKRRKRSKRYFTQITEMAINAYNNSDDQVVKDKVFNRFIYYPFDKLAENVIHTYKTYYFDVPYEDVKANVVAFLNEKIHKFNGENGRAFSYFTVVARMKSKEKVGAIDTSRNITNEVVAQNNKEAKSDFIDHFTKYIDYHLYTLFLKDRDRAIADSINELFKNRYDLYSYNKKALYILIRERTGVHTQYITKVVGKLKGIYVELYAEYTSNGHISIKYKLKDNNG